MDSNVIAEQIFVEKEAETGHGTHFEHPCHKLNVDRHKFSLFQRASSNIFYETFVSSLYFDVFLPIYQIDIYFLKRYRLFLHVIGNHLAIRALFDTLLQG